MTDPQKKYSKSSLESWQHRSSGGQHPIKVVVPLKYFWDKLLRRVFVLLVSVNAVRTFEGNKKVDSRYNLSKNVPIRDYLPHFPVVGVAIIFPLLTKNVFLNL